MIESSGALPLRTATAANKASGSFHTELDVLLAARCTSCHHMGEDETAAVFYP